MQVVLQNVRGHAMGLGDTVLVVAGELCDAGVVCSARALMSRTGGSAELITKHTKEGLQYDLEDKESDGDQVRFMGHAHALLCHAHAWSRL